MKKIYFILGQTAVGKTAFASTLARTHNGAMVNCDSRQIYKYLNIVTGKADNPADVAISLVDILSPEQRYSAYDYAKVARQAIETLLSKNKLPIIVGGTGLYAYTLLHHDPKRYSRPDTNSAELELDNLTVPQLQTMLCGFDHKAFGLLNISDRQNPRRLVRAIQKLHHPSSEVLDFESPNSINNRYQPDIVILLHENDEVLRDRIIKRVDERLAKGAVDECQAILKQGYDHQTHALQTIGYQSIIRHIQNLIDQPSMRLEWIAKEYQYAKRQKTYMLKYFPEAEVRYV